MAKKKFEEEFEDLSRLRRCRENFIDLIEELEKKSQRNLTYWNPFRASIGWIDKAYKEMADTFEEDYVKKSNN